MFNKIISILLLLTVSGCKTVAKVDAPEAEDVYLVQIGDTVTVDVYNEAELSNEFRVAADGCIHYPLLGRIKVVNMRADAVEKKIRTLLESDYLQHPIVTVSVSGTTARPVMIFGEVREPGTYNVKSSQNLTLLHIISQAGGFTDIAARDKVRIVRLVDGKEQTIKVRVSDLLRGRDGITDINLKPGDLITVPETIF